MSLRISTMASAYGVTVAYVATFAVEIMAALARAGVCDPQ